MAKHQAHKEFFACLTRHFSPIMAKNDNPKK
jgi:hypothetical protein